MTQRMVGGQLVDLTSDEEAVLAQERDAFNAAKPARAMDSLRTERNALLVSSDWTQGNDSPLDDGAKTSWTTYRQALRDLPANTADPAAPVWPVL